MSIRHARSADAAPSLTATLAEFLRDRPHVWIDGRQLATVAGAYAWRTRLSELRRSPFGMTVRNRQRRVDSPKGRFTISEYQFVPAATDHQQLDLLATAGRGR
jgi:hypothetical protein